MLMAWREMDRKEPVSSFSAKSLSLALTHERSRSSDDCRLSFTTLETLHSHACRFYSQHGERDVQHTLLTSKEERERERIHHFTNGESHHAHFCLPFRDNGQSYPLDMIPLFADRKRKIIGDDSSYLPTMRENSMIKAINRLFIPHRCRLLRKVKLTGKRLIHRVT